MHSTSHRTVVPSLSLSSTRRAISSEVRRLSRSRSVVRSSTKSIFHSKGRPTGLVGDRKARTPPDLQTSHDLPISCLFTILPLRDRNAGAKMMIFHHNCCSLRELLTGLFQSRWEGCLVRASFLSPASGLLIAEDWYATSSLACPETLPHLHLVFRFMTVHV